MPRPWFWAVMGPVPQSQFLQTAAVPTQPAPVPVAPQQTAAVPTQPVSVPAPVLVAPQQTAAVPTQAVSALVPSSQQTEAVPTQPVSVPAPVLVAPAADCSSSHAARVCTSAVSDPAAKSSSPNTACPEACTRDFGPAASSSAHAACGPAPKDPKGVYGQHFVT